MGRPSFKRELQGIASAGIDKQRVLARGLLGRALGFKDCPPATLDGLVASIRIRHYGRGEYLGRRGDQLGHLALLLDGLVDASIARADGHRPLMGMFRPGDVLGLVELLDGAGMANDIVVRTPSVMALIPAQVLHERLAVDPALALACARQCAFRCRHVYDRLSTQAQSTVEVRVASVLCTLVGRYGDKVDQHVRIDLHLSQADLADWSGASRQRVNAVLKTLEADGVIALAYAGVTVLDLAALQARGRV